MINKLYVFIKNFLKENLFFILAIGITVFLIQYKLPFYIDSPGGLIDTDNRVSIEGAYESKGSFNMTYVSEIQANIPLYLFAKIKKDWDIITEKEAVASGMTMEEVIEYGKITMKESNKDAIKIAYEKAGLEVIESNKNTVLLFKTPEARTDLTVGDVITKVGGKVVNNYEELGLELEKYEVGSKILFEVKNNNRIYNRYAYKVIIDNEPKIGIVLLETRNIKTDPKCALSYSNNESGASGGLMTTLTIYNNLVEEDLTHGEIISGTGTIERDGSVGEIAGVKYKLIGAVKNKAKVFFVPAGDNYEEAIKVKKERDFDIEVVPVETFYDAVEFLENYKR